VGLVVAGAWCLGIGLGLSSTEANERVAHCHGLPRTHQLQALLVAAPSAGGNAGGLFHGAHMWGAVVNRDGEVCAFATSTADPTHRFWHTCSLCYK